MELRPPGPCWSRLQCLEFDAGLSLYPVLELGEVCLCCGEVVPKLELPLVKLPLELLPLEELSHTVDDVAVTRVGPGNDISSATVTEVAGV